MDIAKDVFDKKRVVIGKLADAGFVRVEWNNPDEQSGNASISPNLTISEPFPDSSSEPYYLYTEKFMDGDLTAVIKISLAGEVSNSVIDTDSGDLYLPMNIEAHTGSYVGQAREDYRVLLEKVAEKCCSDVPFVCDQANRIASDISAEYGVDPEFPFTVKGEDNEKVQDRDTAVFRHKDTGKWFAIIMTIKRGKLETYRDADDSKKGATDPDEHVVAGKASASKDDRINVMNVKIYPEELEVLLKEPGLYRCYHMNKKQWISIALDDECSDERIMELLKISFGLTSCGTSIRKRRGTAMGGFGGNQRGSAMGGFGGNQRGSAMGGFGGNGKAVFDENGSAVFEENSKRYWLIPSKPSQYDVGKGFRDSGNDTVAWHHRIDVVPGDIVYIYQTEPVASIMWECEVLESYLPIPEDLKGFSPNSKYRMILKRLRSFEKGEYPRAWLNEHGVAKTVRGQRSAPDELVQAMRESK